MYQRRVLEVIGPSPGTCAMFVEELTKRGCLGQVSMMRCFASRPVACVVTDPVALVVCRLLYTPGTRRCTCGASTTCGLACKCPVSPDCYMCHLTSLAAVTIPVRERWRRLLRKGTPTLPLNPSRMLCAHRHGHDRMKRRGRMVQLAHAVQTRTALSVRVSGIERTRKLDFRR